MNGPWTTQFAPGPPLHHPALGLLPGPPVAMLPLRPGEPTLLVDDRNAGEHIRQGAHEVRLISTAYALALLCAARLEHALQGQAAAEDEDEGPITRWNDAAAHLGVSTDTLARRRKERDPARRCYFVDEDALLAWWRDLTAPAGSVPPPEPKPGNPPVGRPRQRPAVRAAPVDFTRIARELNQD